MRPRPKLSMVHLCFMTNNTFSFIFISTLCAPASLSGWIVNGAINVKSLEDRLNQPRVYLWTNLTRWTASLNKFNKVDKQMDSVRQKATFASNDMKMPKLWWTRRGPAAMIGVQDHYLLAVVRFGPSGSDLGWSCSRWVWSIWARERFIEKSSCKASDVLIEEWIV